MSFFLLRFFIETYQNVKLTLLMLKKLPKLLLSPAEPAHIDMGAQYNPQFVILHTK